MAKQETEVEIRHAVEADRQTLITLVVRAFADVRAQQSGEILARTWAHWEANHVQTIDLSSVVLAEVAGKAVGFASYEIDRRTRIGTVSDNAVLPEYRGKGIGAQLLTRVLGLMKAAGMEYAEVSTGSDVPYTPARRMYERQGFTPYFRSVSYMKKLAQSAT